MTWQKNETRTALADVRVRFYMGDSAAVPPNVPRFAFQITTLVGSRAEILEYDLAVQDSSSLTGPQKAALITALSSLLTESLTALGFVNV